MTAALTVERSAAGPRPDDRQRLLISLVRERDAAGTSRQLEAWVHRRGLASLQAFRSEAVPELLSAADDAWLEGCLQEPLEQRLLKLDALAPAPQAPAASAAATPASAWAAAAPVAQVPPDPAAVALAGAAIAAGMVPAEAVANSAEALEPMALEPQPQAAPGLESGALGGVPEGFRAGPDAGHGVGNEGCAEPLASLELESPAATDRSVSEPGIGFGGSPSGQGLAFTPPNPSVEVVLEEPPLPVPSAAKTDAEWLATLFGSETLGLEAWPTSGHHEQEVPETLATADYNPYQGSESEAESCAQVCTESRAGSPGFDSHTEVSSAAGSEACSPDSSRVQTSLAASCEAAALSIDSQNNCPETWAAAGSTGPALDNAAAAGSSPLDAAGSEATGSSLAEPPERQEPAKPATVAPFEAIASAPPSPAPEAEAGAASQEREQEQTTNPPATADPSQDPGRGRGLSSAGSALADAPQRLRRKLFGSLGKARLLMRACLEEAISTLHPHGGDADPEEEAPSSAATPAAGVEAAPERLGSFWPGGNSPLAAATAASHPSAAPIPPGANAQGMKANRAEPTGAESPAMAPPAAWNRPRGNSLPGASLDVPLQGPPAPAPAHLADLRAWLPGSSDQDRRAS